MAALDRYPYLLEQRDQTKDSALSPLVSPHLSHCGVHHVDACLVPDLMVPGVCARLHIDVCLESDHFTVTVPGVRVSI